MSLPTASGTAKRGSLTIAGSGIASVVHMTLETVAALESADKVFYSVGDPVTESFIQEKNDNTLNLSVFYDVTKQRHQTYVQMAEVMLREVRAGQNVLGIFYGHPGFFAASSHRALTLARREGYDAKMLPGLSSFDYMLAELEIEPAHYGCMIYEATDLLVRGKRLDPSVHNVVLQIAITGVSTLVQEGSKFQRLIDHLIQGFGAEHKVVLYAGAVLPQASSAMVVYSLEDFRNEQLVRGVNSRSSLYIPPLETPPLNESDLSRIGLEGLSLSLFNASYNWVGSRFVETVHSGPVEAAYAAELDKHAAPEGHRSLRATPAMKKFMLDLALDPKKLKEYQTHRSAMVEAIEGLTESEKAALQIGTEDAIGAVMLRASDTEPTADELRSLIGWLIDMLFPVTPYSAAF